MERIKAKFSFWLAKTVTGYAGRFGFPLLIRLMRRLTGTQVTVEQMLAIRSAVKEKGAVNLLVFGVGNDSEFWMNVNRNGRTVFVEDDGFWLSRIKRRIEGIVAHLVSYGTRIEQWKELMENPGKLEMQFPREISETEWDVVLVDAPTGWGEGTTGRMKSIYAASRLVKNGHVFVHDCEREVEIAYCDRFLKKENLVQEIKAADSGYLRHYRLRF